MVRRRGPRIFDGRSYETPVTGIRDRSVAYSYSIFGGIKSRATLRHSMVNLGLVFLHKLFPIYMTKFLKK